MIKELEQLNSMCDDIDNICQEDIMENIETELSRVICSRYDKELLELNFYVNFITLSTLFNKPNEDIQLHLSNYINGKDITLCSMCQYEFGRSPRIAYRHSSRTRYDWDGIGEDPNADVWLCDDCADAHHAHWDEQQREYYYDKL